MGYFDTSFGSGSFGGYDPSAGGFGGYGGYNPYSFMGGYGGYGGYNPYSFMGGGFGGYGGYNPYSSMGGGFGNSFGGYSQQSPFDWGGFFSNLFSQGSTMETMPVINNNGAPAATGVTSQVDTSAPAETEVANQNNPKPMDKPKPPKLGNLGANLNKGKDITKGAKLEAMGYSPEQIQAAIAAGKSAEQGGTYDRSRGLTQQEAFQRTLASAPPVNAATTKPKPLKNSR